MAGVPINQEILHVWEIKDAGGNAVTGLAGNMTATLTRFPTTSSSESATESVAIAEIGSTGFYAITYTPTKAYTYKCRITESSLYLEYSFEDDVDDAPSAASATNAYCTEADVVAFAQMGDYTTTTTPTEAQVLGFMQMRAAQVYSTLARYMGADTPGPSAYSTTIDTSTDAGLALSLATRLANALGAAMDAVEAAGAGEAPSQSTRVQELGTAFEGALSSLRWLALSYVGWANRSSTHISTGEMSTRTTSSTATEAFVYDEETSW